MKNNNLCWLNSTRQVSQPDSAALYLQGHSFPAGSHILDATLLSRKKQTPDSTQWEGGKKHSKYMCGPGAVPGRRVLPSILSSLQSTAWPASWQQAVELEGSTQQRQNKHSTPLSPQQMHPQRRSVSQHWRWPAGHTHRMGQHSKKPTL